MKGISKKEDMNGVPFAVVVEGDDGDRYEVSVERYEEEGGLPILGDLNVYEAPR